LAMAMGSKEGLMAMERIAAAEALVKAVMMVAGAKGEAGVAAARCRVLAAGTLVVAVEVVVVEKEGWQADGMVVVVSVVVRLGAAAAAGAAAEAVVAAAAAAADSWPPARRWLRFRALCSARSPWTSREPRDTLARFRASAARREEGRDRRRRGLRARGSQPTAWRLRVGWHSCAGCLRAP